MQDNIDFQLCQVPKLLVETLEFSIDAGVGLIRLTRPENRNPFDLGLRRELGSVLDQVRDAPQVRALVPSGGPGAFCAGGHLQDLAANADGGRSYWQQRLRGGLRLVTDLLELGRPLIAVVDGPASGAGFALALTADIVLATTLRARFAVGHSRLGLVPDLGALHLLRRLLGLQRAKELAFSTREVDANEAKRLSLVMDVHPSESVEARARHIALSMTSTAPAGLV